MAEVRLLIWEEIGSCHDRSMDELVDWAVVVVYEASRASEDKAVGKW